MTTNRCADGFDLLILVAVYLYWFQVSANYFWPGYDKKKKIQNYKTIAVAIFSVFPKQ